jgi:hypothetical protein
MVDRFCQQPIYVSQKLGHIVETINASDPSSRVSLPAMFQSCNQADWYVKCRWKVLFVPLRSVGNAVEEMRSSRGVQLLGSSSCYILDERPQ